MSLLSSDIPFRIEQYEKSIKKSNLHSRVTGKIEDKISDKMF